MVSNVTVSNVNRFGKKLTLDQMLRTFKKKCEKANLMQEIRRKEYYVSPSLKKKLKHKEAIKRIERENVKKQAYINQFNKNI